jgi:nucleoid-associated protein YgaU
MSAMTGELTKLKIEAFKDAEFKDKADNGEFLSSMTPEKYTINYKIVRNETTPDGSSGASPQYAHSEPENLVLDFLFDRTGVLEEFPTSPVGIVDDLEKFKKIIFSYDGGIHQPYYVKIHWGSLLFKGTMSEMAVEFKLFRPDGAPLRAVAKVTFLGFIENNLRAALENKSSPDLTHYRTVKDGETLPLMTHRIYGDSKYYLEVARLNGLSNFRKLAPGQQIWFPPIQKQS